MCSSRLFGAIVLAALALGCGAEPGPIPLVWLGKSGVPTPASTGASVFWVRADVSGAAGPDVLVDTGAPLSLLNPNAFGGAVGSGSTRLPSLTIGPVTLWKVPVVGIAEALRYAPSGRPNGGILGFTAYGQFVTSFDYQGREVVLGRGAPLEGLADPTTLPLSLEGGGLAKLPDGGLVDFPASRVLVQTLVEGRALTMLVDTGSSWVALASRVFGDVTSDGRATLSDRARLASGTSETTVTRLRSVALDALEVARPVAASGAGIDALLTTLQSEVGRPVDGALGAPFLREFFVTMDYPAGRFELRRYAALDFIHDEYERIGFELEASVLAGGGLRYGVAQVFPGTDAEKLGVWTDEIVVAVDGADLASMSPGDADGMLLGPVGSTKTVMFADRALSIRVDELLPLP